MSVVWDELLPFEFLDFVMFELGKWDLLYLFNLIPRIMNITACMAYSLSLSEANVLMSPVAQF